MDRTTIRALSEAHRDIHLRYPHHILPTAFSLAYAISWELLRRLRLRSGDVHELYSSDVVCHHQYWLGVFATPERHEWLPTLANAVEGNQLSVYQILCYVLTGDLSEQAEAYRHIVSDNHLTWWLRNLTDMLRLATDELERARMTAAA